MIRQEFCEAWREERQKRCKAAAKPSAAPAKKKRRGGKGKKAGMVKPQPGKWVPCQVLLVGGPEHGRKIHSRFGSEVIPVSRKGSKPSRYRKVCKNAKGMWVYEYVEEETCGHGR